MIKTVYKWFAGIILLVPGAVQAEANLPVHLISLPDGFSISVYADDVPGARSMALSDRGTLFVGTRRNGKVYALRDTDKDGLIDKRYTLVEGLYMPNGVALRDGHLYVAEVNHILRFNNIEKHLDDPPEPDIVNSDLPSESHHGWKFIRFGPDGKLYVPVGAPCNVCLESGYAEIKRLDINSGKLESFAYGVRNTVGFDWHPDSGELWFTDNGRDNMGDDQPPDELNHAPDRGMHFGFPYCHGGDIADPSFGARRNCSEFVPPARKLGPHVASLGMRFYTGKMFPASYHKQVFIAEHGSWNRSNKIGYRISLVRLEGSRAISYTPFATGWLQGEEAWGRPVDIELMPDGSMLVSDDMAGAIYRISYKK